MPCGRPSLIRHEQPAAGARRMAQTAAHLVDHVIPHVPVLAMLHWLGVKPSYSWPHVSDDNAYAESLFPVRLHCAVLFWRLAERDDQGFLNSSRKPAALRRLKPFQKV